MSVLTRPAASLALRVLQMSLAAAAWSGCRHPSAGVPELSIVSDEVGYRMPNSIPAGLVHITLHNTGTDLHEALLVRFTDKANPEMAIA
jgi:hypothetical protein